MDSENTEQEETRKSGSRYVSQENCMSKWRKRKNTCPKHPLTTQPGCNRESFRRGKVNTAESHNSTLRLQKGFHTEFFFLCPTSALIIRNKNSTNELKKEVLIVIPCDRGLYASILIEN